MTDLTFERVCVQFGEGPGALTAVDDVSLHVPAGSTVGLVGESGSGKSTLAAVAVGLVTPTAGRVIVGGQEVAAPGRRRQRRGSRRRVQLVFQDPYSSLDPRMTVGESIGEGMVATGRRISTADRAARVAELLDLVRLDRRAVSARPTELSGGMRQRVALARALAAEPEVLIADEITSALDVSVQGTALNLLTELQRELRLTLLFVSHNLAVVRYVSDRIAVMRRGALVEQGDAATLITSPSNDYTRDLVDAVPQLGRRWESAWNRTP